MLFFESTGERAMWPSSNGTAKLAKRTFDQSQTGRAEKRLRHFMPESDIGPSQPDAAAVAPYFADSGLSRKRLLNSPSQEAKRSCKPSNRFPDDDSLPQFALVQYQQMPLVARQLNDHTPLNDLAIVPYVEGAFPPFQPVSRCTIEQLESDDEEQETDNMMDVEV